MDPTTEAVLVGLLGLVIGAVSVASVRLSDRSQRSVPQPVDPHALQPGVSAVLAVLSSGAIVLDAADAVVSTSPWAVAHGLVRDDNLIHDELRDLARQVRRDGEIQEVELDLPRGPLGRGRITVGVRVAPLGSAFVLLLVDDRTTARRVEEVRRDFVVNVSHELKTPVGGLVLLSDAVLEAKDDPEAVVRFARRMQVESTRLTSLVQEIVDLSRLQIADTLHEPVPVDVALAATAAIDQSRLVAESRAIEVVSSLAPGVQVFGDADLLTTAIRNLVGNAIHYSDPGTRVAVSVRSEEGLVEIAISDQGHGIHKSEQARIFERFYRVDAARSRDTGGTGLGLAIVKHICANHGGEVTVWSEEGHGSTFTMRLPAAPTSEDEAPVIPAGRLEPPGLPGTDRRSREVTR
ncbi:MAG: two-component sensor histidine kinase [Phycicoccus sp.]|nr:two-component sensor histidine kinase [Phycicoccus sp.]NMM33929.1 two-component sensor histidine kinase [Phycicoccus sp.]